MDFFHLYLLKTECTADLVRFFLTFLQTYINDNDNFYTEFINVWNSEIKPFIMEKFPIQKTGYICLYSDISFFIQLIDGTLKKKKIIKREDKKYSKMKAFFAEINKEEIEIKRTNSMVSLRPHSQTIDSKATRNSSLKRENSDLNKQSSLKNINNIKDLNNNKADNIDKEKPKINEENKIEINKEDSINENIQKNEFTFEEFLNKIINDDKYIIDNIKLIYHFCQQCFCFLKVETLFEQIFYCYKNLKKDNSEVKLNKLIEFTNVLVIEMMNYYKDENVLNKFILIAKDFYNKLLSDLLSNLGNKNEDKKEEKKNIQLNVPNDSENNNIIVNDKNDTNIENNYEINKNNLINMNLDVEMRFIPKEKENDNIVGIRKSKTTIIKLRQSIRKSVHFLEEEEKAKNELEEKSENNEDIKLFQESKSLRKSKNLSLSKNKVKDIIKEEEDEKSEDSNDSKRKKSSDTDKDIYSDNDSSSGSEKDNNINIKKRNNSKNLKVKIKNNIKEIVDNIIIKVNIPEIISLKEKRIDDLENMWILLRKAEEKEKNIDMYLKEVKDSINFYKELQRKINKEKKELLFQRKRQKRFSKNFATPIYLLPTSKKTNVKEILTKGYFCVTDWKTEDIGNQLMILSKTLLSKIHPRELYKAIFLKKDKEITSPNVVECINKFNRLTSFIMEDILSYNKPKDRARVYEKWVLIADYCKKNKDYNDLIAIFSVFNHYVITGLKLTLKEVRTRTNSMLNKIKSFCTVEGNYKKIREDMDNSYKNGELFIPYLGMLLRDLNFFEEKSKYINEKGYINFDKIEKISEMFDLYFKNINQIDDKLKIPELDFFNDLEVITEEQLEEKGNNLEPQFKYEPTDKKRRKTNIDKKYFAKYKIKGDDDSDDVDNNNDEENAEPVDLDMAFCD